MDGLGVAEEEGIPTQVRRFRAYVKGEPPTPEHLGALRRLRGFWEATDWKPYVSFENATDIRFEDEPDRQAVTMRLYTDRNEYAIVVSWRPGEPIGSWFRATFHTSGPFNIDPKPFEGYDWRSDPNLKLKHIILQWWVSERALEKATVDRNIVYFDDIVIATEYIGPQVKNAPNKP